MKPVYNLFLMGLAGHALAQSFATDPWRNDAWGSRVWTRTSVSSRFSVYPFRDFNSKDLATGGGQFDTAEQVNTLNYRPEDSPVSTWGKADSVSFSVHATAKTPAFARRTLSNGIWIEEMFSTRVMVEVWDRVALDFGQAAPRNLDGQILVHGSSTRNAKVNLSWYLQEGPPSWGWNWETRAFDSGINGHIPIPFNLRTSGQRREYYVGLRMTLDLNTLQEASFADLGNSIRFQWNLPQGTQVSSASGRFAAEPVNPVPEPASLFALAFGSGLAIRRKRMSR